MLLRRTEGADRTRSGARRRRGHTRSGACAARLSQRKAGGTPGMARWRPRTSASVQDGSRWPPPCQVTCRRRVGLPLLTCDPIGGSDVADGPVETVASSGMTHGVGAPVGSGLVCAGARGQAQFHTARQGALPVRGLKWTWVTRRAGRSGMRRQQRLRPACGMVRSSKRLPSLPASRMPTTVRWGPSTTFAHASGSDSAAAVITEPDLAFPLRTPSHREDADVGLVVSEALS